MKPAECGCEEMQEFGAGAPCWSTCTACRKVHDNGMCPHKRGRDGRCRHCDMPMTTKALAKLLAS